MDGLKEYQNIFSLFKKLARILGIENNLRTKMIIFLYMKLFLFLILIFIFNMIYAPKKTNLKTKVQVVEFKSPFGSVLKENTFNINNVEIFDKILKIFFEVEKLLVILFREILDIWFP